MYNHYLVVYEVKNFRASYITNRICEAIDIPRTQEELERFQKLLVTYHEGPLLSVTIVNIVQLPPTSEKA